MLSRILSIAAASSADIILPFATVDSDLQILNSVTPKAEPQGKRYVQAAPSQHRASPKSSTYARAREPVKECSEITNIHPRLPSGHKDLSKAPKTYAAATNLAAQHPERAAEILSAPLAGTHAVYAPKTYAAATNLAFQHPEHAFEILNTPLASNCRAPGLSLSSAPEPIAPELAIPSTTRIPLGQHPVLNGQRSRKGASLRRIPSVESSQQQFRDTLRRGDAENQSPRSSVTPDRSRNTLIRRRPTKQRAGLPWQEHTSTMASQPSTSLSRERTITTGNPESPTTAIDSTSLISVPATPNQITTGDGGNQAGALLVPEAIPALLVSGAGDTQPNLVEDRLTRNRSYSVPETDLSFPPANSPLPCISSKQVDAIAPAILTTTFCRSLTPPRRPESPASESIGYQTAGAQDETCGDARPHEYSESENTMVPTSLSVDTSIQRTSAPVAASCPAALCPASPCPQIQGKLSCDDLTTLIDASVTEPRNNTDSMPNDTMSNTFYTAVKPSTPSITMSTTSDPSDSLSTAELPTSLPVSQEEHLASVAPLPVIDLSRAKSLTQPALAPRGSSNATPTSLRVFATKPRSAIFTGMSSVCVSACATILALSRLLQRDELSSAAVGLYWALRPSSSRCADSYAHVYRLPVATEGTTWIDRLRGYQCI